MEEITPDSSRELHSIEHYSFSFSIISRWVDAVSCISDIEGKERGKKREGGWAVVKLRATQPLPSSRNTISLGGIHSDTKNWDPPDGRKRSSRDKGI